jgi:hypothetical protein
MAALGELVIMENGGIMAMQMLVINVSVLMGD